MRRLAVVDRGEPAVRVLSAAGELTDPVTGERLRTIAVSTVPRAGAWWAREASETLVIEAPRGASSHVPDLVAALVAARADAVWLGLVPCADRAVLAEECAGAGILVLGPDAAAIRAFGTPTALAAVASAAGVPARATGAFPEGARRLEVDAVRDTVGTVWTLGLREVTVLRDSWAILTELPATGVPDETAAAMEAAARALLEHAAYRGSAVVHFALERDGILRRHVGRHRWSGHPLRGGGAHRRRHPRHAPAGRPRRPTATHTSGRGGLDGRGAPARPRPRPRVRTDRGTRRGPDASGGDRRTGRRGPAGGGRRRRRARPRRRHGDVLGPRARPGALAAASGAWSAPVSCSPAGRPTAPVSSPSSGRLPSSRVHLIRSGMPPSSPRAPSCPSPTPSPSWQRRSRSTTPTSPSSSARSGPAPSGDVPSTPNASASPSTSATAAAGTGCEWTVRRRTATASTTVRAWTSWWTRSAPSRGGFSSPAGPGGSSR